MLTTAARRAHACRRRVLRRWMATTAAGAVVAVMLPAAAAVADDPITPVNCHRQPRHPHCVITATAPARPAASTGTGRSTARDPDACDYRHLGSDNPPPAAPQPGAWYVRQCHDDRLGAQTEPVWIPDTAADPAVLAQRAIARLGLQPSAIGMSPPADRPLLVRVPVWLWLDPPSWRPHTASASVPGLSVTATATPTTVVWDLGDGARITCHGPGTVWRPGSNPSAGSPSCGHVYRASSNGRPGGTFVVTATVTWQVSWMGGGQTGSVPPLTTTTSLPVRVVESQAVVSWQP